MRIGLILLMIAGLPTAAFAQTNAIGTRSRTSAGAGVGYDTGIAPGTLGAGSSQAVSSYRDRPTTGVTGARTSAGTGGTRD